MTKEKLLESADLSRQMERVQGDIQAARDIKKIKQDLKHKPPSARATYSEVRIDLIDIDEYIAKLEEHDRHLARLFELL